MLKHEKRMIHEGGRGDRKKFTCTPWTCAPAKCRRFPTCTPRQSAARAAAVSEAGRGDSLARCGRSQTSRLAVSYVSTQHRNAASSSSIARHSRCRASASNWLSLALAMNQGESVEVSRFLGSWACAQPTDQGARSNGGGDGRRRAQATVPPWRTPTGHVRTARRRP